ncbi:MAG: hypothetical protein K8S22_06085 [Betaproteobacteria bacterium]|nr:hypothetical protein [Betaproteobacteria bacterium]
MRRFGATAFHIKPCNFRCKLFKLAGRGPVGGALHLVVRPVFSVIDYAQRGDALATAHTAHRKHPDAALHTVAHKRVGAVMHRDCLLEQSQTAFDGNDLEASYRRSRQPRLPHQSAKLVLALAGFAPRPPVPMQPLPPGACLLRIKRQVGLHCPMQHADGLADEAREAGLAAALVAFEQYNTDHR